MSAEKKQGVEAEITDTRDEEADNGLVDEEPLVENAASEEEEVSILVLIQSADVLTSAPAHIAVYNNRGRIGGI